MNQRPLGDNQRSVLKALQRHGSYRRGGAWVWNSWSGTERILESLVKRGLVEVIDPRVNVPTYRLTEAGKAVVS